MAGRGVISLTKVGGVRVLKAQCYALYGGVFFCYLLRVGVGGGECYCYELYSGKWGLFFVTCWGGGSVLLLRINRWTKICYQLLQNALLRA